MRKALSAARASGVRVLIASKCSTALQMVATSLDRVASAWGRERNTMITIKEGSIKEGSIRTIKEGSSLDAHSAVTFTRWHCKC